MVATLERTKPPVEEFLTSNAAWIHQLSRKLSKNLPSQVFDADDVAQEISRKIVRSYPSFDPAKGAPTTWIARVAWTRVQRVQQYAAARGLHKVASLESDVEYSPVEHDEDDTIAMIVTLLKRTTPIRRDAVEAFLNGREYDAAAYRAALQDMKGDCTGDVFDGFDAPERAVMPAVKQPRRIRRIRARIFATLFDMGGIFANCETSDESGEDPHGEAEADGMPCLRQGENMDDASAGMSSPDGCGKAYRASCDRIALPMAPPFGDTARLD